MNNMDNIPWPKRDSQLFVEDGEYLEFSHIGWGSLVSQFSGYIRGYELAAQTLVKQAITSRNISVLDTTFYPICFLYRQYIELQLKWLFIGYSERSKHEKIEILHRLNHDLNSIWAEIKPMLLEHTSDSEKESVENAESYILQFHRIDKSSFAFRYPITKQLDSTLGGEHRYNLKNLFQRMKELHSFFAGCAGKLDEIRQWKADEAEWYLSQIS